jgi:homocysteine S-methyltransferase
MSTRYEALLSKINSGQVAILDCGTSTELERRGATMDDQVWSARVSIESFDVLVETHQAYIDAGADVITVNGYASSRLVLGPADLADEVRTINMKNIEAALLARERCGNNDVLVAGSISTELPFTDELRQRAEIHISKEVLFDAFNEMVSFYEDGEVDLVLLEMMSVPSRMLPLFECVSSSRLPVWCGLSAERSDRNATITGYGDQTIPLIDNIQEAVNFGFEGMGIMHSSVDLIGDAIELVKTKHDGLIMAYPDSGYFKSPNWQFEEIITPDHLVQFATQWKQAGTNIIGGCCGLGPEHTEALCNLK